MKSRASFRIFCFGLIFLLFFASFTCKKSKVLPERILWYDEPASYFEEALPLGNGRIGAMVYGGVQSEHILLNEETLWAGGPVDPNMNPEAVDYLPKVREALFNHDYSLADKTIRKMQGKFSQSFLPLGDLYIDFQHGGGAEEYYRDLDIRNAIATTRYRIGSATYSREVFVSHPDQLLIIKLTASEPEALGFVLRCSSQLRYTTWITEDNRLILEGRGPVHAEPNYRGDVPNAIVYDDDPEGKGMRFRVEARILKTDGNLEQTDSAVSVKI